MQSSSYLHGIISKNLNHEWHSGIIFFNAAVLTTTLCMINRANPQWKIMPPHSGSACKICLTLFSDVWELFWFPFQNPWGGRRRCRWVGASCLNRGVIPCHVEWRCKKGRIYPPKLSAVIFTKCVRGVWKGSLVVWQRKQPRCQLPAIYFPSLLYAGWRWWECQHH